jgi:hypothetical protein
VLRQGALSLERLNAVLEPLGHAIPGPDAPVDRSVAAEGPDA